MYGLKIKKKLIPCLSSGLFLTTRIFANKHFFFAWPQGAEAANVAGWPKASSSISIHRLDALFISVFYRLYDENSRDSKENELLLYQKQAR